MTNLNTNQVKNSAGTEVEFNFVSTGVRSAEYSQNGELPSKPYRLNVKHQETGTGFNRRRRSLLRFDKTVASDVDATKTVNVAAYMILDAPVGALNSADELKNVVANILSLVATTGAATTVLFDCTGTGAGFLVNGSVGI